MSTDIKVGNEKLNKLGLDKLEYKGRPSTLCSGCGHDSITAQIIGVCWELSIDPQHLIKMSGIGCSSKSPAYFMNRTHGFNALHGRFGEVAFIPLEYLVAPAGGGNIRLRHSSSPPLLRTYQLHRSLLHPPVEPSLKAHAS